MDEQERVEARRYLKLQEQLKNPTLKKSYELIQNKSKEESKRKENLERWSRYGHYVSPENEKRLKGIQGTAQQKRMEEKLKNFM